MQLCHCGCLVMNTGGFLLCVKDMQSPHILGICRYYSYETQLQHLTTKTFQNSLLCLCISAFGSCAELRQCAVGTGYPKQRLLHGTAPVWRTCLEGQLITEGHWRWTGTTSSPKATKTSSSLKPLEVQVCNLYDWVNLCQTLGFQIEHWVGFEIVTTTASKSYFSKGYPEEGLIKSLSVTLLQNNSYSVPKH